MCMRLHTRSLTASATCFCLCPSPFAAQFSLPENHLQCVTTSLYVRVIAQISKCYVVAVKRS